MRQVSSQPLQNAKLSARPGLNTGGGQSPSDRLPEQGDLRILVVDDDAAHAESIVALLAAHELTANFFSDPAAGLASIREQAPDVLILDLNMPGVTGLDILAAIAEDALKIRTIVLTGENSVSAIGPIVRFGAFEYLAKPPDPKVLIATIGHAMQLRHLERESQQLAALADNSNKLHKFLVDATPDLIYMLDGNGNFSFVNNKLQGILNADARNLMGQPWHGLFDQGPNLDLSRAFRNRFNERRTAQRATQQYEFDYVASDGSSHRLEFSATGIYENQGRLYTGTYGVVRDVTAKRRAEQDRLELQAQIQQASKMEAVGQLAGGIAHDFNNILASIIGYAELVQTSRERLASEQVDDYLGEVVTAGHRARDLISQMLTFTRAGRGEPQPTELTSTIADVSRMLRAAIPTTIDIDHDYQDAVPPVMADPVQLQQVVLNLLINARDAIDGHGRIEMSVRVGDQDTPCASCGHQLAEPHVVFSVSDTGHGIDPNIVDKIFQMYYTTRAPGSGTGIGLWLVNDLVHDYQGHVTLETGSSGTRFDIHLPSASIADEIVVEAPLTLPEFSGRIVVVDDEVSVSSFIGEVLRNHGYEVVLHNDSTLALDYLRDHIDQVELLITDQRMPRISGAQLMQRARELKPDVHTILMTGYTDEADTQDLAALGIDKYLTKPFRIEELFESIAQVVDAAG